MRRFAMKRRFLRPMEAALFLAVAPSSCRFFKTRTSGNCPVEILRPIAGKYLLSRAQGARRSKVLNVISTEREKSFLNVCRANVCTRYPPNDAPQPTSADMLNSQTPMQHSNLPIFEIEQPLLETLRTHKRLVLSAPTGSGKSTQVPQMLLDSGLLGDGQVTILLLRRLPTRLLASWVARARNVKLGDEVGYQMRFDSVISSSTRICYVTEGVLLRRMLHDPELHGVSAIIFDEFHERHLYGDITLARAVEIQQTSRPDLIIVVMSATLDVAAVERYLQPCALLSSEGRAHPVAIEYLSQAGGETPVWSLAVKELRRVLPQQLEGDVLIFMPGTYEIARTVREASAALGTQFAVFPLHGELTPKDQDAAVARYDRRKIVVATNVAETSLTIDGVRLVIDSGLARIPRYDPYRGINTLLIEKISRAAADQRAGRAGRTAPGRSEEHTSELQSPYAISYA